MFPGGLHTKIIETVAFCIAVEIGIRK